MKQGIKSVQELYKELEEQRENRKDIIADTRSLVVNSTDCISTLSVSTGNDVISYTKAQQRFILPDTGFASTGYKMGT